MKEILEIGGKGLLIPAVFCIVALYVAKGLFGLHARRAQHRKEFLEMWDQTRQQDDLWLEVAVRQWLGAYLPAHVIRLGMTQPDKAQSLVELSELWPLLRYDRHERTVQWLHAYTATGRRRFLFRVALVVGYFIFALIAFFYGIAAAEQGPDTFKGWLYGAGVVFFGMIALACMAYDDTVKSASVSGEAWIARINQSVAPLRARSKS